MTTADTETEVLNIIIYYTTRRSVPSRHVASE